jgi:2-polyprenyl-3-methyl-5-hydroxy-6-metoxy-1,4-benzoquinol methylase
MTGPETEMEYISCNLCGSDTPEKLYEVPDFHFHPDEIFTVVRCRNCGLGYLNPRPRQEVLDKYYPEDFYANFTVDAAVHAKRYVREARYILKHARPPTGRKPKMLDVGCANGDFPRHMISLGWEVEGLEIGAAAKKITDFKVYNTLFSDFPLNTPTYDVVTAWAVMEHVFDPMAYFKKAHDVLLPGGVFIFLVTNLDSLSSNGLFREDLPRHTYFFNEKTIKSYLEKSGFSFVDVTHANDVYEMVPVGWLLYKLNQLKDGSTLTYKDIPLNFSQWTAKNNLPRNGLNFLKFLCAYPLVVLDRVTAPVYGYWQMLTGTYGISTYIARRN